MRPVETSKLRKRGAAIAAAAGIGAVAAAVMPATPAVAAGNPSFDGILAAKSPTGFPVSPQFAQLGAGGVTLDFNVSVRNLTSQSQTVALNFSVHHILTYNGKNVADGQPGQPGISFSGPQGTTQTLLAGTKTFSTTFAAQQQLTLHRTFSIDSCGYFQVDLWAPEQHPTAGARHRETLASGFTRVLGCKTTPIPKPTPTPGGGGLGGATPTPTPGGGSGTSPLTGGTLAAVVGTPSTGAALVGGTLGLGSLLVIVGVSVFARGRRRENL